MRMTVSLVLTGKQYFLDQQSDGNLCVYKGSDPSRNQGEVWCSGGGSKGSKSVYSTVLQADGNLCTYATSGREADQASTPAWCSGTPVCAENPCPLWAAMRDDGRFCVHHGSSCSSASAKEVWCSTR